MIGRRILFIAILLLAGTVLGLLTCEFLLRLFSYEGEEERFNVVLASEWGDLGRESWVFRLDIDPSRQDEVILESGVPVPIEKAPGDTRVLFIGDSGTAGPYVGDQDFVKQFSDMLDAERPGHRIEAINAGVIGMTNVGEYRLLERQLLKLHPDIVVLGLFMSNDINFNLAHEGEGASKSLGRRVFDYLRPRSAFVHFATLRAVAINNRFKLIRAGDVLDWQWLPRQIALVDAYGFHMLNYPAGETALYMKDPSELVDHAFDVLDGLLQDFVALGRAHDFEFRLLIIPSPSAVAGKLALLHFLPDPYEELRRQHVDVEPEQLDFGLPTRRVLEICERRGLVCFDPTDRFERDAGMDAFFPEDEHTTILGHSLLARTLVEDLDRLMDGDRSPRSERTSTPAPEPAPLTADAVSFDSSATREPRSAFDSTQ